MSTKNGERGGEIIDLASRRAARNNGRVELRQDEELRAQLQSEINELLNFDKAVIEEIYAENLISDESRGALEKIGAAVYLWVNKENTKIIDLSNIKRVLEQLKNDIETAQLEKKPDRIFPFIYRALFLISAYLNEREEILENIALETPYARVNTDTLRNYLKKEKKPNRALVGFINIMDASFEAIENRAFRNTKIIKKIFHTLNNLATRIKLKHQITSGFVGEYLVNLVGHIEQGTKFGAEIKILPETAYKEFMLYANTTEPTEKERVVDLILKRLGISAGSLLGKIQTVNKISADYLEKIYLDLECASDAIFILNKYGFGDNIRDIQKNLLSILTVLEMTGDNEGIKSANTDITLTSKDRQLLLNYLSQLFSAYESK